MYSSTSNNKHFVTRTGSHATKGSRRGYVETPGIEKEAKDIPKHAILGVERACDDSIRRIKCKLRGLPNIYPNPARTKLVEIRMAVELLRDGSSILKSRTHAEQRTILIDAVMNEVERINRIVKEM